MKLFPIINAPKPATKPSTMKRFDAVFTAIRLLVNLAGWSFAQTLNSLLHLVYNRMISLSFDDPSEAAKAIKWSRAYYLAFIRGGRAFADLMIPRSGAYISSFSDKGSSGTGIINRIMDYRDEIVETGATPADLLAYDRIVFAILSFDRIMTFSVSPDFSTITKPSSFVYPKDSSFFDGLPTLLERLGITKEAFFAELKRQAKKQRHIIMSTGGVNGPASWTAYSDAQAILGNTTIYNAFQSMARKLGMSWLLQDLVSVVSIPSHDNDRADLLHLGRLHDFEEWGGKNRIVAIVDYWTQVLLTPLHNTIFHFLAKIESDGTFDQDAATARVARLTLGDTHEVYSYDLSAATDRLPISIQREILTYLVDSSFANAWSTLLVGREYFHRGTNRSYTYAVGQPMGSKSSWAMLALTHHVIVQSAAIKVSSEPYLDYAVLGDDVTLTNSKVGENYLNTMNTLDVTINMQKSVVHHAGVKPAAEFAKRVFIDGEEITTIPVKLIAKTIMNGRLLPSLQNELVRRGFKISATWIIKWLVSLTDVESGRFLLILNAIPVYLSSIKLPVNITSGIGVMSSWFGDSHVLTEKDVRSAHLFVAVTEALKRVDNLLRQAQIIHMAIETNAFGYTTFDAAKILGWSYKDPDVDVTKLGATLPKLSPTHPIVKASQDEMDRIGALLSDLASGNSRVVEAAQNNILDMFRSALVDFWMDDDAARAQNDRSLVQKAMTLLADIILNRTSTEEGKKAHFVDFTVNLAYVNRLWTVSWKLGGDVLINSVRSRVLSTTAEADTRLDTLFDTTSMTDLFHIQKVGKKGRKAVRVDATPSARVVDAAGAAAQRNPKALAEGTGILARGNM